MMKWLLLTLTIGMVPWSVSAQDDDDMYFVAKKKTSTTPTSRTQPAYYGTSQGSTYSMGSNRDVDEYNRRGSSYQVIAGDSTANDIINFSAVEGVYPDSTTVIADDDYSLTRQMNRWDGYDPGDSFWQGYAAGRYDAWDSWHSPWYYSSFYPWYDPWYYDPWYYNRWYYGYGWHYGYAWYDPWYYDWYGPYRYHYWGYYPTTVYVAGRAYRNDNTGTISRLGGRQHTSLSGYRGSSSAGATNNLGRNTTGRLNGNRQSSLRNRTLEGHTNTSPNVVRNSNVRTSNVPTTTSRSTNTYTPTTSSSGNFSGSRSTGSSGSFGGGGGFSGGRSSGGGGGGGGRLGGRR